MSNATSVRASGIVASPSSSPLPFGVMFRNFSPRRLFTSTLARVERPNVAFLTSKSAITFSGPIRSLLTRPTRTPATWTSLPVRRPLASVSSAWNVVPRNPGNFCRLNDAAITSSSSTSEMAPICMTLTSLRRAIRTDTCPRCCAR